MQIFNSKFSNADVILSLPTQKKNYGGFTQKKRHPLVRFLSQKIV
jgi:hypothetical protein